MGDVERSRLKSESCATTISSSKTNSEMVNYPQWPQQQPSSCFVDQKNHDEPSPITEEENQITTPHQRKRKKSECDDFLGFKKHCIDEATDMYRKCLKYSALSNNIDLKTLENGYDEQNLITTHTQSSTKSEYAQYLGLQPTVKFKCIKCSTSNFPTLTALNKHLEKCPESTPSSSTTSSNRTTGDSISTEETISTSSTTAITQPAPVSTNSTTSLSSTTTSSTTNFKITRRVYLCSACGVYFEIWKLFLHMRTAHRRYICLICLGLFSIAEKLSNHLIVKHNILAKNYDNLTNFFNDFTGQNFIMCCQCEKMFTEKDNFAGHICEINGNTTTPTIVKQQEYLKKVQQKSSTSNTNSGNKPNMSILNKVNSPSTTTKVKNKILPSEHVTADTSPLLAPILPPSSVPILQNEDPNSSENEHTIDQTQQTLIEPKEEDTPSINDNSIPDNNETKTEESTIETKIDSEVLPEVQSNDDVDEDDDYQTREENLQEDDQDNLEESLENVSKDDEAEEVEQRRVPKVTLKIPPPLLNKSESSPGGDDEEIVDSKAGGNETDSTDSDDSFKLTMEVDEDDVKKMNDEDARKSIEIETFPIADSDIPIVELGLRPPLDKVTIQSLLKDFIRATCYTCIYCNYARKIAVNGKQLGLHMIAEHRFSATADSITAEELLPTTFVKRIKDDFETLQSMYFNLESYDNTDSTTMIPYDRTYECFQCRFVTTVHKELYLHNRKMHQKTLLLCIMCKSTFYSYSELLCHLCPGVYLGDVNVLFRCCLCPIDNVPSAFRLMVHLRKRHHACDVCLETCNSQSKLSNHVWKHKLHHLCYRCGIAYRNKPDITKHLFWKHGTESVLCKKCLQKKWPHVYHFCIPPLNFMCEECNKVFSKAVALKVHKRLHSNIKPYACTEQNCSDAFISKKLLEKHLLAHREPTIASTPQLLEAIPSSALESDVDVQEEPQREASPTHQHLQQEENFEVANKEEKSEQETPKELKSVVDVLDLPALNLSESDSSDSDSDTPKRSNKIESSEQPPPSVQSTPPIYEPVDLEKPPIVIENIWDNFKNYQASVGKRNLSPNVETTMTSEENSTFEDSKNNLAILLDVIMNDHDYCAIAGGDETRMAQQSDEEGKSKNELKTEKDKLDHDYCDPQSKTSNQNNDVKKATSDSSSDSDSSSCSCGSNCSCSSSSSNDSSSSSSSSSDSDSSSTDDRHSSSRNLDRKQKRKERAKNKKKTNETSSNIDVVHVEEGTSVQPPPPQPTIPVIPVIPIYESDLYTDESETDEDFYDECPQLLAKKLIEEKKNQLLLDVGGPPLSAINGTSFLETSRSSTPNLLPVDEHQGMMIKLKKPKNKSKKRKKSSQKRLLTLSPGGRVDNIVLPPLKLNIPHLYFKSSPNPQLPPSTTTQVTTLPSVLSPSLIPLTSLTTISTPVSTSNALLYNSNTGSGSETDSTLRLSKRRRVPNRFYGYSSDDDQLPPSTQPRILTKISIPTEPPQLEWNKEDLPSPTPCVSETPPYVPPIHPAIWNTKVVSSPTVMQTPVIQQTPLAAEVTAPSSSSSDSDVPDSDDEQRLHISQDYSSSPITIVPPPPSTTPSQSQPLQPSAPPIISTAIVPPPTMFSSLATAPRPAENLYCYCQCPYDEVSEMIACDGKKCAIEWFHFECVGIMVPPKGKWFCPDCRKQTSSSSSSSQQQQQQRPEYFMSQ